MTKYNKQFYSGQQDGSYNSARIIIPIIMQKLKPKSVVDIGCGTGVWLKAFQELGVKDIQGVDGEWVKDVLQISKENFYQQDLSEPFSLLQKYDLAISLECAEHLKNDSAKYFVKSLCGLSDCIVFSAATKFQGGTDHRNEQFIDYWVDLFNKQGYEAIDNLRPKIWSDENVDWWYRQNILMFIHKDKIKDNPELEYDYNHTNKNMLSLIHPRLHIANMKRINRIKKFIPMKLINWMRGLLR